MDLTANQLFRWCDEEARIERILWIEPTGQRLVTIDVADAKAWPSFVDRSFLERHFTSGDIRLLDSDMYGYLRQPDSAFPLSQIRQRDRAWKMIEGIVAHQEGEGRGWPDDGAIFHPSIFGLIVQTAVERTGRSKRWVRACLRHYWQRGQMKNALLPQADRHITSSLEDRRAEKVQERDTNTWNLLEQETSCADQPRPVFKGIVERSFALNNDKLFSKMRSNSKRVCKS